MINLLLTDTYEKGKQDVLDEEGMDMSEGEDEKVKEKKEDAKDKPLLPPEVFKHLRTAIATEEKKEEKPVIGITKYYNEIYSPVNSLDSFSNNSNKQTSLKVTVITVSLTCRQSSP